MKILGMVRGITKKGGDYTVLHCMKEFDDYLKDKAVGSAVQEIYVSKKLECKPNQNIEVVYGVGFEGKAYVRDVVIIG